VIGVASVGRVLKKRRIGAWLARFQGKKVRFSRKKKIKEDRTARVEAMSD